MSPLVGSSPLVMAVVMVVASGLAVLALATPARGDDGQPSDLANPSTSRTASA